MIKLLLYPTINGWVKEKIDNDIGCHECTGCKGCSTHCLGIDASRCNYSNQECNKWDEEFRCPLPEWKPEYDNMSAKEIALYLARE